MASWQECLPERLGDVLIHSREATMTATAAPPGFTVDSILEQLERFHQRATYGAVAAVVNSSPRSLMKGRERSPRSSWIVNRESGEPSGYPDEQIHTSLKERDQILDNAESLRAWLNNPG